jgi:PHD/YefM family antitoxin component YafN of YafNO toxin-antitoxin module
MNDPFKRILNLVRKTGDTVVVTDSNGKDSYVVMDFDLYESMMDGMMDEPDIYESGIEDLDGLEMKKEEEWQIPKDFVIDDPEGGLADDPVVEHSITSLPQDSTQNDIDIWNTMQKAGDIGETWDISKMNDEQKNELGRQYEAFAAKNVAEAIKEVDGKPFLGNKIQEEKPSEDDFSEEQFYLEPVE